MKYNTVRSYSASGKIMNEEHFRYVDEAYKAFCEWCEVAEGLPKGYETTIVRYDDTGYIMNMHTVIGMA